jgi:hypothetical protein
MSVAVFEGVEPRREVLVQGIDASHLGLRQAESEDIEILLLAFAIS